MANFVSTSLLILLGLAAVLALPRPDEERYLDKEYTRELITWLAALTPALTAPCHYYNGNGLGSTISKRNSEYINTLLGLTAPRGANDDGK